MDDLSGLLVEGFGFRPRDRSAPMAASKGRNPTRSPMPPLPTNPKPSHDVSLPDDGLGDLGSFFGATAPRSPSPPVTTLDDDLFGSFSAAPSSSKMDHDDVFGPFSSVRSGSAVSGGDLLGDFGGILSGSDATGGKSDADSVGIGRSGLDDLIPGFGGGTASRDSSETTHHKKFPADEKATASMPRDPFMDLESTISSSHPSDSFVKSFEDFDILSGIMKSQKTSSAEFREKSFFHEFEGSVPLFTSDVKANNNFFEAGDSTGLGHQTGFNGLDDSSDIDFMFAETKKKNDPLVDLVGEPSYSRSAGANKVHAAALKSNHGKNSVKHVESSDNIWFPTSETSIFNQSSVSSSNIRKAASSPNILDDWNSLFGAPSSSEFQEIDGEPEERRRARLERHRRTLERVAKALDEKNERDIQMERENAEKHRISERLDAEIKQWSAGKEGNLRALLSSLQYVLWPDCGWQPVTLTDIITSAAVKRVYKKATLCIHPDKVQQKGANLQQKYTAEKVFDILKEAWKKFNAEELS